MTACILRLVVMTNSPCSLINYCNATRDYMVPSVWGPVSYGLPRTWPQNLTNNNQRSKRGKIHTHHNNQKAAAQSCEGTAQHLILHQARRPGYVLIASTNPPYPSYQNTYNESISISLLSEIMGSHVPGSATAPQSAS